MDFPDPEQLIGPLTAAEWASLRLGAPDDPLHCCNDTSDVRDAIFATLRMGGGPDDDIHLRAVWHLVDDHGDLGAHPLLARLFAYYVSGKEELPSDRALAEMFPVDPDYLDHTLDALPDAIDLTTAEGPVNALGKIAPRIARVLDAESRAAAVRRLAGIIGLPAWHVALVVDAWRGNIGLPVVPPTAPSPPGGCAEPDGPSPHRPNVPSSTN